MRDKIEPETFHKWVEAILGRPISKDDAYHLWLTFGIEPEGGRTPRVPLGLISRVVERVREEFGSEWAAEIANRLADEDFRLDRRDIPDRIGKCSGFDPQLVAYWADRRSDPAPREVGEAGPQVVAQVSGSEIVAVGSPYRGPIAPTSGEWPNLLQRARNVNG